MIKKITDKKLDKVKATQENDKVSDTGTVSSVSNVSSAKAVDKAGAISGLGKRRPTRTMTLEEREQLFKIVNEEATKLFGSKTAKKDRELVEGAVKMAIDSGLLSKKDEE